MTRSQQKLREGIREARADIWAFNEATEPDGTPWSFARKRTLLAKLSATQRRIWGKPWHRERLVAYEHVLGQWRRVADIKLLMRQRLREEEEDLALLALDYADWPMIQSMAQSNIDDARRRYRL